MKILARLLALTTTFSALAADQPNIVFIMADDLGWSDVGFNGAKFYETPNLDKACAEGMKFNRGYSGGPNCLPTRACLISGMYTPRTQIWTPGGKAKGPVNKMRFLVPAQGGGNKEELIPSKLHLEPSVTSIAEVLKTAGYKTARFGKWHVGPDTQGFDISDPSGKGAEVGKKFYGNPDVHEWLTDASCQFIEDHKNGPFFLYLCHWDVHTPIRARKDVIKKYDEKLKNGTWDKKWNTTYAAMVEAVDTSVGRVHAKLAELGLSENTLFIFTSDNGPHAPVTHSAPLRGAKGAFTEGGVRVPTFMTWPGTIKGGTRTETPITSVDFMPTFAKLSGAELPSDQPIDGVDITPLLRGGELKERAIFWHYPLYMSGVDEGKVWPVHGTDQPFWRGVPSSMICRGDWKLIELFEDDSVVLFNITEDPGESQDLASTHPKVVQKLRAELDLWQKDTKAAIPDQMNPSFGQTKESKRPKRKQEPK